MDKAKITAKDWIMRGFLAMAMFGSGVGVATISQPTPVVDAAQVRVDTVDGRHLNTIVVNGKAVEVDGKALPVAPLMDWENIDIRQRNEMRWCLNRLPNEEVKNEARAVLNIIYGWYAGDLPMWKESCQDTGYYVQDTAQHDCGIGDQAVGCAVYRGQSNLVISYNGNLYRRGLLSNAGVRGTLAHELGHGFNLGHYTPAPGEKSSMTPIRLPDGPPVGTDSNDPVREDYLDAERYYGLRFNNGSGQQPPPDTPIIVLQEWAWTGQDYAVVDHILNGDRYYKFIRRRGSSDQEVTDFIWVDRGGE